MPQPKNIRTKLTLASAALLQATSPNAAEAPDDAWEINTAILFYQENDSRVTAIEPVISGSRDLGDGEKVNLKAVFDSLTGATPNGAHESTAIQTFTNPSGKQSYTSAAGDTPLDDTFLDTRVALSGSWENPIIDERTRMILGGNLSKEYDYASLGMSASFQRDYNNRNTTYSASLGYNSDTISPSGGIPTAFENMRVANSGTNRDGADDSKTIADFMFGVTQVINRRTLMQFNLGLSSTSGYMNDPYKIISLIDGTSGLPVTPADSNDLPYLYESRPDSRSRQVFFWKTVHHLTEDVINVSYRYHTDDWGIDSHTIDFHYRYELDNGSYLQPHLRYYTQSAADFFTTGLVDGQALPEHASADYRLGELVTNTIGIKYATPVSKNSEFNMRIELINQVIGDTDTAIGDQINHDLTDDLSAFVLQVGYDFYFAD